MDGVLHNAACKPSVVDVLYGEKRDTNDSSCCVHYALQALSIFDVATSEPQSNAVSQDTLNGASVKGTCAESTGTVGLSSPVMQCSVRCSCFVLKRILCLLQMKLLSKDFGKHLLEVEDLLQKHTLLEADISVQADRVQTLNAAALKFTTIDGTSIPRP